MLYDGAVVIALCMLAALIPVLAGFQNRTAAHDPGYTLYLLAVWFVYLGWCWTRGGMTLGMRAWNLRIQSESGELPGWGQSIIRFLVSLLSAAALGLGFAWSLFDNKKRCWHDIASRTSLVTVLKPNDVKQ